MLYYYMVHSVQFQVTEGISTLDSSSDSLIAIIQKYFLKFSSKTKVLGWVVIVFYWGDMEREKEA